MRALLPIYVLKKKIEKYENGAEIQHKTGKSFNRYAQLIPPAIMSPKTKRGKFLYKRNNFDIRNNFQTYISKSSFPITFQHYIPTEKFST